MSDFRCPHCRTALPEKATFCAACGRRIEGWSSAPADATPALGANVLAGDDAATRQMEPTPSLMRAVALSKRTDRHAPRWWIGVGMLVVALTGGSAGFFVVRLHKRAPRPQLVVADESESAPDEPPPAVTTVPSVVVPSPAPPKNPSSQAQVTKSQPPKPTATKPTETKPAAAKPAATKPAKVAALEVAKGPTRISAPRLPHAKLPPGNGLPHKAVRTDSQSIAQQTIKQEKQAQAQAKHEPPSAAPPPPPGTPPLQMPAAPHETSEASPAPADDRAEAQASVDADGVRFVVHAHLPQVRACYGRAFKDASPGGTVEVGFAIDPSGRAKNVRTERNSTDSESLARCLEARLKEWQFPRPVGGDFELIYPFVFAPGS